MDEQVLILCNNIILIWWYLICYKFNYFEMIIYFQMTCQIVLIWCDDHLL